MKSSRAILSFEMLLPIFLLSFLFLFLLQFYQESFRGLRLARQWQLKLHQSDLQSGGREFCREARDQNRFYPEAQISFDFDNSLWPRLPRGAQDCRD
ncbi:MAG: hypothetical protein EA369_04125 [Bradymonadales bacterium]|nr:MAG: hypothetical protein EA369_04125 [Bradymonadales bacterium]